MADFFQNGLITTLHDLRSIEVTHLEAMLRKATPAFPIGLVLPVTAADSRAAPFARIIEQLHKVTYIDQIVVCLGIAPEVEDYRFVRELIGGLGDRAEVLWTDGPRIHKMYEALSEADIQISTPGKGRQVWTAFGYLLADARLKAFVLHDCDIVNYDRSILARLCLPMAHPSFDFEFCKAYYARCADRMYGRVARLLVTPFVRALCAILGRHAFLDYLHSFRYPLSGEFAVAATLAKANRIPCDWGLEVGTLAEVFRNTSVKRVCQVDLSLLYEHKHQPVSLDDPSQGLMRMAMDILTTLLRTFASMGVSIHPANFLTLRSAYLRMAQDCIRQYYADALINGLEYDRQEEEMIVEAFSQQVMRAGETVQSASSDESRSIANWARVTAAFPDFPQQLREAARTDAREHA